MAVAHSLRDSRRYSSHHASAAKQPVPIVLSTTHCAQGVPELLATNRPLAAACVQIAEGRRSARRLALLSKDHGLSESEVRLLWAICTAMSLDSRSARTGTSQRQLANRLPLSPAHISAMVERLRQRGLAVLAESVADRRCQHSQVTAAGRRIVRAISGQLEQTKDATGPASSGGMGVGS